jgi:sulfur carrier protein
MVWRGCQGCRRDAQMLAMRVGTRVAHTPFHIAISVNGADREIPPGTTVAGLLALLGVERGRVAVERNHDVVPRKDYDAVTLAAGDRLEIVAFVGGG